ncbi:MAG: acylphosphatase [Nitrososphaerota archaeon]
MNNLKILTWTNVAIMKAVKIKIAGRVLRTGYRWHIVELMREKGLAGYVEITSEGNLHLFLQGEENLLKEVMEQIRNPPPPTTVKEFDIEDAKPDPKVKTFTVKYGTIGDELHEGFGPMQLTLENSLKTITERIEDLKKYIGELNEMINKLHESQKQLLEIYRRILEESTG